jgi:hypothetical protein
MKTQPRIRFWHRHNIDGTSSDEFRRRPITERIAVQPRWLYLEKTFVRTDDTEMALTTKNKQARARFWSPHNVCALIPGVWRPTCSVYP